MTVNGTGTIDVNIDKGFVTASEMNWSIAGPLPFVTGIAPTQPATVQASFKMTLNATE